MIQTSSSFKPQAQVHGVICVNQGGMKSRVTEAQQRTYPDLINFKKFAGPGAFAHENFVHQLVSKELSAEPIKAK